MKTGADMEAPAESDKKLSTRRKSSGRGVGERISYGSARSSAMERRRRRIRRQRILMGVVFLSVVLLIGGILFGVRNLLQSKEKTELLEAGIASMEQGDYETAILNFERELEAAGGRVGAFEEEVLLYRAEAEYQLGDYAAALHTYQILLKEDKRNLVYQKGVAIGLMETGDLEGALAMDVINAHVYNRMAKAQIEAGQYEDALNCVTLGITALDEDAALRASGKDGIYTAEEALSIRRNLAFNEAVVYEYMSDYETALKLFESYVSAYGPDEEVQREITFLQTRQGNY